MSTTEHDQRVERYADVIEQTSVYDDAEAVMRVADEEIRAGRAQALHEAAEICTAFGEERVAKWLDRRAEKTAAGLPLSTLDGPAPAP